MWKDMLQQGLSLSLTNVPLDLSTSGIPKTDNVTNGIPLNLLMEAPLTLWLIGV